VTAVAVDAFAAHAERVARLCEVMAERFAAGGRLLAVGHSPAERSDVRHVTVEFVHPVIVGKRALPALGIAVDGGPLDAQMRLVAEPGDMVIGFGAHPGTVAAVAVARERGCLVLDAAMEGADAFEAQELTETLYHVLWELVHVFLEHGSSTAGAGASAFLYPFLEAGRKTDTAAVRADVAASVVMKAREATALREQTLADNAAVLDGAVADVSGRLRAGGRVLALGNGGSATDAMDVVADLRAAGLPALDLTEDTAVLTALANDVGVENVFARQVIAHGRPADALLAISTSGGSANVLAALAEARRRGLGTIALVGYDGGVIAGERLADHVVVTRSEHIPRIQEAQATAYHLLVRRLAAGR
jgi:D-sedoheptulose 7-phosphate isomerase